MTRDANKTEYNRCGQGGDDDLEVNEAIAETDVCVHEMLPICTLQAKRREEL